VIYGKEVLLEKVNLKNSTYKAAIAKLEAQLAHKEEMGEVLHLVDFEQLKIESQQHLETIDAKNKDLLGLKLSTGKTVQVGYRWGLVDGIDAACAYWPSLMHLKPVTLAHLHNPSNTANRHSMLSKRIWQISRRRVSH